jgi:anti-repressor protein
VFLIDRQIVDVFASRDVLGRNFKIYGDFENPIFLAKNVGDIIEHSNIAMMLKAVDADEKFINVVYTPGGLQEAWFLTEDGVYELLTKSRSPKAKQLKLTIKEVLKDIRDKAKTALNEGFQAFHNSEFGEIRISVIDGKPYAVGIDVARVLEYANPSKAILDHCDDFLKWEDVDSLGRTQNMLMISEGDIYRLIIAAANQSRNPEIKIKAKGFEKWVFDEVLPEIRKNGYYMTNAKAADVIENPDAFVKELEERNKLLVEENRQLIEEAIENEPKVDFANAIMATEDLILLGDLSKVAASNGIRIGQNRTFKLLRKKKLLTATRGADWNAPTQKAMDLGLFKVCERVITTLYGCTKISKTTYVTPEGQEYILRKLLSGVWQVGEDD